jgi:hypothetical protein
MVNVTDPEFFVPSGSVVTELLIDAVFVAVMPAGGTTVLSGAVAVTVMLSVAPDANVARVQVTARVG